VNAVAHEKREFNSGTDRFAGKQFAKHPYDRRSGTGRGRDVAKEGHGKGNWGKPVEDDVNPHATEGIAEELKEGEEKKPQKVEDTVKDLEA
jgi:hypothetical protein